MSCYSHLRGKICLPNNRELTVQRTLNLLKRFRRDESFLKDYKGFMNILEKKYAEKVPDEQLHRKDGRL